jgi:hypothetical protein
VRKFKTGDLKESQEDTHSESESGCTVRSVNPARGVRTGEIRETSRERLLCEWQDTK